MEKLERNDYGDFAKCLTQLSSRGQRVATAKQAMRERIKQGASADICTSGFWLPENWNSVQGDMLVALQEYNPIIPYAQEAVNAHESGNDFYLTNKVLLQGKPALQVLRETAEEDASKPVYGRRVLISKDKNPITDVPTKSLGEQEEIIFLARGEKLAGQYGEFLHESGIKETSIYRPPIIAGKDLARGFWFCRLDGDDRSDFYGYSGCINGYGSGSLLGVSKSAEGTPRKVLPYTQRQLDKQLQIVQKVRAGNVPASKLERVVEFLASLKQ
jgi:hypothetical protein